MKKFTLVFISLLLAWVVLFSPLSNLCQAAPPQGIEGMLLVEDWEGVYTLLENSGDDDTVSRFLKAHAARATNRNNEALVLFVYLREPGTPQTCLDWAISFRDTNPENPVAHFLAGDAYVRSGNFQLGIDAFTQALKIDGKFSLALASRGAVYTLQGDSARARNDLYYAIKISPGFADAHAGLGTYWVLQGKSTPAIACFDSALQIDPNFALAYNGRGCARYGRGAYDLAIEDFDNAFILCPILFPAEANESITLAKFAQKYNPEGFGGNEGMSMLASLDFSDGSSLDTTDEEKLKLLIKDDPVMALTVLNNNWNSNYAMMTSNYGDITESGRKIDGLINLDLGLTFIDIGKSSTELAIKPLFGPAVALEGLLSYVKNDALSKQIAKLPDSSLKTTLDFGMQSDIYGFASVGIHHYFDNQLGDLDDIRVEKIVENIGFLTKMKSIEPWKNYAMVEIIVQDKVDDYVKIDLVDPFGISKVNIIDPLAFGPTGMGEYSTFDNIKLREYGIPQNAPVAQFLAITGATGKSIAPIDEQAFLLIKGANLVDPMRLNTAKMGFQGLGANVFEVPPTMEPSDFAKIMGFPANQTAVMRIDPVEKFGVPKIGFPKEFKQDIFDGPPQGYVPPGGLSGVPVPQIIYELPKVNTEMKWTGKGVSMDLTHALLDDGEWPVMTVFLLAYDQTVDF